MEKVENVFAQREIILDNEQSRKGKASVKAFFDSFDTQIEIQWNGLKKENTAYKALNNVIAGIAGSKGEKPYIWLIKNFSRYITIDQMPVNKTKDKDGKIVFKLAKLTGNTARGLLKKCALNCIESQRIGNRFSQTIVEITK